MGTHPIFVCGTGRSGTTVVGRLLGHHPDYAVIPIEVRLHAEPTGLPGVLRGSVTPEQFAASVFDVWFVRSKHPRHPGTGLHTVVERETVERALEEFVVAASSHPALAAQRLMCSILDPYAHREGKKEWVEMTPRTIQHASALLEMFPDARFVQMVRDGRDVAASLVALGWKDDFFDAMGWWSDRMRQAHKASRSIPGAQLQVVSLEALVAHRRDETYGNLLRFLAWSDEPALREYFVERMGDGHANIGRWRDSLPPGVEVVDVERHYDELLAELRAHGVDALPEPVGAD